MDISKIKIIKNGVETILNLTDKTIFKDFWDETSDFVITDEYDNVIVQFQGGNIKTKNFDSTKAITNLSVVSNDDCDFAIEDENGNRLIVLKDGNIEVKGFNSTQYNVKLKFEEGSISPSSGIESYSLSSFNSSSRTAYFIDTKGATYIKTDRNYRILMFDANHSFLGEMYNTPNKVVSLKSGVRYIRLSINTPGIYEDSIVLYGSSEIPIETKKVAQRVEQGEGMSSTDRSEKITYRCDSQICTTARLMLPPNYTIDGKKVPLILWDSGDGDFMSWDYEMGNYQYRLAGLKFCRDMGFAVLQIYSWGSDNFEKYPNNNRAAMPIPSHLLTHIRGVEYVCDRYNVDSENIFQLSKSGSGKLSLYYALDKPEFNLRHIYAMAPVFDDFVFLGAGSQGYRRAMNADMRFENVGEQLDYFIVGTPPNKGGNEQGTSWKYGGSTSLLYKETDTSVINNIREVQDFVVKNGHKFTCMGVSWRNLIGKTFKQKIIETTKFSNIYWHNIVELTTEPSDWETNYNNYAILDDETGLFLQLDRNSAPIFEQGKYYKTQSFTPGDSSLAERCFNRYDLNIVTKGAPITIIMAQNDEQTPYWNCLEVVKQIRNAGGSADIITLDGGGHSGVDMGTFGAAVNVETLYGDTYDIVPIGWFLSVCDIIRRFLKKESVGFPIISLSNNTISISSQTSGASIYYTTDGSEPTINSTLYSEPIQVSQGDNYTLKAVAYKSGLWYSDIMSKEVLYIES